MTETKLTQDEAFAQYRPLIYKHVHRMVKHTGDDFETVESDAFYAFCHIWHKYEERGNRPNTGNWNFGGWLNFSLRHWLAELHRRRCKVQQRMFDDTGRGRRMFRKKAELVTTINDDLIQTEFSLKQEPFDLQQLTRELSDDAKTLVKYLTEKFEPNKLHKKRGILVRVIQEMGWTAQRILESFSEIREALGL